MRPVFSSKIIAPNRGSFGFFFNELRKCARTSHVGGSFCIGNGVGIEVLAKPIFVRGLPLQWKRAPHRPVPPSLFIQNHCAKSGPFGFSERTPEACTNLSCRRFVLCWGNGEGIEVLAKPIFVREQPFNHAPCSLLKLSAAYPNAEGDGGEGDGVPFRKNLQTVEGFGREIVYVRDLSEFAEAVGNGNFRVFGGRVESRENFGGAKAAVGVEQNSRCRIIAGKELEKSVGGIVRKPQRARNRRV